MNKTLFKASSSHQGFSPLLPGEPRILNASAQARLTETFLLPALAEVETFFFRLRAIVDPVQRSRQPMKLGEPYPLGQCLEIAFAVQNLLRKLDASQLDPVSARGYAAFCAFLAAGGVFRKVWGDLRGEFFQNAFQMGTLYVDVANDTVTITKPKVEILPFAQARLTAITDFHHFVRLARRYWQDTIYPNHVLPALAPYCPLIHVNPKGMVILREPSDYMIALVQAGQFGPSEEILRTPPMPQEVFAYATQALAGTRLELAADASEGRTKALRFCREYRSKRWHASAIQTGKITAAVIEANSRLSRTSPNPDLYTGTKSADSTSPGRTNTKHLPDYIPLCRVAHAGKRWRRSTDYHFAARDLVIPLTAREMPKAAMALPLGFVNSRAGFMLVAVQGLAAGKNAFVSADGRWLGSYIPEAYRHYPFALAKTGAGRQLLAIDQIGGLPAAGEQGEPLFNADGTPTLEVLEVLAMLKQEQAGREATLHSCAVLHKHNLLQPWQLKLQSGGNTQNIRGLYRIDEAALRQVSAEALKELQLSDALSLAYCQLLSMQHIHLLGRRSQA